MHTARATHAGRRPSRGRVAWESRPVAGPGSPRVSLVSVVLTSRDTYSRQSLYQWTVRPRPWRGRDRRSNDRIDARSASGEPSRTTARADRTIHESAQNRLADRHISLTSLRYVSEARRRINVRCILIMIDNTRPDRDPHSAPRDSSMQSPNAPASPASQMGRLGWHRAPGPKRRTPTVCLARPTRRHAVDGSNAREPAHMGSVIQYRHDAMSSPVK